MSRTNWTLTLISTDKDKAAQWHSLCGILWRILWVERTNRDRDTLINSSSSVFLVFYTFMRICLMHFKIRRTLEIKNAMRNFCIWPCTLKQFINLFISLYWVSYCLFSFNAKLHPQRDPLISRWILWACILKLTSEFLIVPVIIFWNENTRAECWKVHWKVPTHINRDAHLKPVSNNPKLLFAICIPYNFHSRLKL